MSITARNPFELRLSAGAKKLPAAPATTVSSRPNSLAALLIASPRESRSRTSAAAESTRTLYWLSSLAASSSLSCERPHRAMSARTEANPRAMARLIPLPPPVMNAARPRRRLGESISHNGVFSLLMEDPLELFARSTVTGVGRHQLKAYAARIELGQPGRDVTLHPAHLPKVL